MITRHAARLGVDVSFGKYVNVRTPDGENSAGYFIQPDDVDSLLPYARKPIKKKRGSDPDQVDLIKGRGIIRVATKCQKTQWIHTLAHEYCHMLQWFRDDPLFTGEPEDNDYQLEFQTELEALALMSKYKLPLSMAQRWKDSRSYLARLAKNLDINTEEKEQK